MGVYRCDAMFVVGVELPHDADDGAWTHGMWDLTIE